MAQSYQVSPRIGLLMATRNQAALLAIAIKSLQHQSYTNFTLTIVDDGSDDQTAVILSEFQQQDKRITVIQSRPQGKIPALNLAMQRAKPSAYYAVVSASCLYATSFFEDLMNKLIRVPKSSGIYANFCEGNASYSAAIFREPYYDYNESLVRDFFGPSILFRSEAFKQAGSLFLSEKKGLLETWQRMAQKFGPFESSAQVLQRWQPHPYDTPSSRPAIEPEKDLYPHLKIQALIPDSSPVDTDWLGLMSLAGHRLFTTATLQGRPNLILCGHLDQLEDARILARTAYAPLVLLINDMESLERLKTDPHLAYVLSNCQLATKTLKIAAALKGLHQPLVYMHGMTPREVNRLLSRIPGLLYRHRTLVILRTRGAPISIQHSLNSFKNMNRPPEFGDLIIYCADRHPATIQWLKQSPYPHFIAQKNAYLPEISFLLKQLSASFVLGLDAGTLPIKDWYFKLWPLLADPQVGMVSGHLNHAPGSQNLPFHVKNRQELNHLWPNYKPKRSLEQVPELSDSAFLMRKTTLEFLCQRHPNSVPMADSELFSHLLSQHKFINLLNRNTLALDILN